MDQHSRIYVAGAQTLVGAALVRELNRQGYRTLLSQSGEEVDLTDRAAVERFFDQTAPEYVLLVAGKSGGIAANQKYPADLLLDNLLVECHVIDSAFRHGVKKLLYLASSCSYPKQSPQPMREELLLSGPLEPTNEAYAVAKIAGVKLCQAYRQQYGCNFIAGIPANPFGPGDDFGLQDSHVIAALLRRMHEAKLAGAESLLIWGTGSPRREFLYADDLAAACLTVLQRYDEPDPINLGGGSDLSIGELAEAIKGVTGFSGRLQFDPSKPDGMPVKLLDSSKLRSLGWRPRVDFRSALQSTYDWFLEAVAGDVLPERQERRPAADGSCRNRRAGRSALPPRLVTPPLNGGSQGAALHQVSACESAPQTEASPAGGGIR